jgi:cobalt-zinc-cadmium efflux system protein
MGHHHHHAGHSHSHGVDALPQPSTFNKAFGWSIGLNLTFALIEAFYAVLANSSSLLADAVHNLGDVLGLAMAWGANWLLTRPSSTRYSYGYKRTTILAALSNALLLVVTSLLIAYDAFYKLLNPSPIHETTVIVVATIGILINGGTAFLFQRKHHSDINIKGAYLHLLYDALISVGVVVVAIAVKYTNWLWLDPLVGLVIVAIILLGTRELLRDSTHLVLDAVPRSIDQEAVKNYLLKFPGVQNVHDFHIWSLSTREVALTAHLVMPEKPLADQDHQTIASELKKRFEIHHVTLQVERNDSTELCALEGRC